MAEAGLNARLGLDATDFERGLKKSETSLKTFGSQVNRSVPQATQAFTNLGRVVQDAPFGFIGIANNIEPLIQSFQSLKTATGSTGGALKALAGSLVGAGGVLFAFSAVSSIALVLIQKYGSLGNAIKELTSNVSNAQRFQSQYNKAIQEGVGASQAEIVNLNALLKVAKDETASKQTRLAAIKDLKKEGQGYLDQLTLENIGNQKTQIAVDNLTKSLILQAKARGLNNIISKNEEKIFEQQNKPLSEQLGFWERILFSQNLSGEYSEGSLTAESAKAKALKNTSKIVGDLNEQNKLAAAELDKVVASIEALKGTKVPEIKVDGVVKVKKYDLSALKDTGRQAVTIDNPLISFSDFTLSEEAKKAFESLPKKAEKTINNQKINFAPKIELGPEALKNIQELDVLKERVNGVATAFDQFLTPVINTAFEALGNGANIFKAIGQSLKALVLQIGITIVKSAILAAILSSIGGGAGVGVVGGFGKIFGKLLSGNLGIGNAASPNFSGVQGGGLAVTVGGQFNVRGTDLVAVVQSGNQRIGRVG
jgi:hypothetical protein